MFTVTVWGLFQFAVVKVRVLVSNSSLLPRDESAGSKVALAGLSMVAVTVTVPVGAESSTMV